MTINKITFNWFYTVGENEGEGYETAEAGKHGCTKIIEQELNKVYDIHSEDGTVLKIFNPNMVFYTLEKIKHSEVLDLLDECPDCEGYLYAYYHEAVSDDTATGAWYVECSLCDYSDANSYASREDISKDFTIMVF